MSYSFSIQPTPKADVDLAASVEAAAAQASDEMRPAFEDHLRAIEHAVMETLLPVIGNESDLISVSVSGHANVDHAPSPSWADEMVTVTIQVRGRVPEEADDGTKASG